MTEETKLIKLFGLIQTLKNFSAIFHHLDDILDTLKQKSISDLDSCSQFLIEILKQILLNDELKSNLFWFSDCNLNGNGTVDDLIASPLNLDDDRSFFQLKFSQPNFFNQKMEYYRLNNQYTDLTIKIGDRAFPAHRIVLQDSCSVWNELLRNNKESRTGNIDTINGNDEKRNAHVINLTNSVDPDIFDELLTFFYTFKVTMTLKQAPAFCSAFKFFNFQEPFEKTEAYLREKVKLENAFELYCLSKQFKLIDLKNQTRKMIAKNAEIVLGDNRVNDYLFRELKMLFHLLNKDKTQSYYFFNKRHMFHALIRWTKVDPLAREPHVSTLLELIPVKNVRDEYLGEIAAENEYNWVFCKRHITLFQQRPSEKRSKWQKLIWPTYKLFCFGGENNRNRALNSVSCFEFSTQNWRFSTPMKTPAVHFGGVAVENNIYLCGGKSSSGQALDIFQSFDCENETWTILSSMPEPRWGCAAAEINGFIYVSGGENEGDRVATVFRYCIKSGVWKTVSSMNDRRSAHKMVSLNGYLYVVSGYYENSFAEKYHPTRDKWEILEKWCKWQKKELRYGGSTIHNGKIYICGEGFFKEYTPNSQNPRKSYRGLNRLDGTTLISYNGKFFAVGGGMFGANTNVMKFDGVRQWGYDRSMEMNTPRKHHCSFLVKF